MKFVIYTDTAGEWRWRLLARNGRLIAEGGEGYKRKAALLKTLRHIFAGSSLDWALEKAAKQ